ncbi:MAG: zf-HC2 domain-containing protein [Planctomycetota bacterium]
MNAEPHDPPLSERQALMMAYVDDELSAADRRRFEAMLAEDPGLAAETADYQTMLQLGHAAASLEPTDRELRRFWSRFYNKTQWNLGLILFLSGLLILLGFCFQCFVIEAELPLLVKIAIGCTLAGGCLLGWSVFRQRRIQHRFDRYRGVLR